MHWGITLSPDFSRPAALALSFMGFFIVAAILSPDPRMGLIGAIMALPFVGGILHRSGFASWNVAVQVGLVLLLLHSLRWDQKAHRGALGPRILAAALWIGHSLVWIDANSSEALRGTMAMSLAVLAVCGCARWFLRISLSWVVCASAVAVMILWPAYRAAQLIKAAPAGLLILLASFVLFGLGTLLALSRSRWPKKENPVLTPTASQAG